MIKSLHDYHMEFHKNKINSLKEKGEINSIKDYINLIIKSGFGPEVPGNARLFEKSLKKYIKE